MSLSAKILLILSLVHAALVRAQLLTPVWIEVGDRGTVARVVVNSPEDCPGISVDGVIRRMEVRRPIPAGLRPACEARISASAQTASVQGKALRPSPSGPFASRRDRRHRLPDQGRSRSGLQQSRKVAI